MIFLSLSKTYSHVNVTTTEFLLGIFNPEDPEQKDNLHKALDGASLKVKDANFLLQKLLTAMIIDDNEVEEVIIDELKEKMEGPSPAGPTSGSSGTGLTKAIVTPTKVKFNSENVCSFFATNKCRFGKYCRKEHPKTCNKFKKFGLVQFNKNGSTEDCEHYHPKACFDSMKTKICKRSECKYLIP